MIYNDNSKKEIIFLKGGGRTLPLDLLSSYISQHIHKIFRKYPQNMHNIFTTYKIYITYICNIEKIQNIFIT